MLAREGFCHVGLPMRSWIFHCRTSLSLTLLKCLALGSYCPCFPRSLVDSPFPPRCRKFEDLSFQDSSSPPPFGALPMMTFPRFFVAHPPRTTDPKHLPPLLSTLILYHHTKNGSLNTYCPPFSRFLVRSKPHMEYLSLGAHCVCFPRFLTASNHKYLKASAVPPEIHEPTSPKHFDFDLGFIIVFILRSS